MTCTLMGNAQMKESVAVFKGMNKQGRNIERM